MTGRSRVVALVAALALVGAACAGEDEQAAETPAADDGGVISLRAGLNDPEDPTIAVTEFLPESVTVEAGTTVSWELAGPEPHTVTFLPPGEERPPPSEAEPLFEPELLDEPYDGTQLANSGLRPFAGTEPGTFSLEFAEPGTYQYFCAIHPLMTGTVEVVEEGDPADTQDEVTVRGEGEREEWLAEGRAAKEELVSQGPRTETEDGRTVWYVEMGVTTEHTDVLAFAPTPAEVSPGDQVVFVNNSGAPHTATFQGDREDLPPPEPEGQEPSAEPPVALDEDTYVNTGWLPPAAPPDAPPPEEARSFAVDVPEAGTFQYVCLLHLPSGMAGTIEAA